MKLELHQNIIIFVTDFIVLNTFSYKKYQEVVWILVSDFHI